MTTLAMSKRPWIYVCPIWNLKLIPKINEELRILDVSFVSSAKLRRIRKRLGFPERISKLPTFIKEKIDSCETHAVIRAPIGKAKDLAPRLRQEVEDACHILRAASWPYMARSVRSYLSVFGPSPTDHLEHHEIFVCRTKSPGAKAVECLKNYERGLGIIPFKNGMTWKRAASNFDSVVSFLDPSSHVDNKWRKTVRYACANAGRSLNSTSKWFACLLNMIALDAMLLNRREPANPTLYDRLNVLLGWTRTPSGRSLFTKTELDKLTGLRNRIVHDAETEGISARHVLLTDLLVHNLIGYVTRTTKKIASKADLLDVIERAKARQLLGMRRFESEPELTVGLRVVRPRPDRREIVKLDHFMT
jgi:hypothetical protein